jgi:chorismate lyase
MSDEARLLHLDFRRYAFVREVHLLCGDQAWVFARSVIPPHTLTGRHRRLAHLGTRPLGAVLFADRSMRRGTVEITCLRPGQRLFEEATSVLDSPVQLVWGRRSVFFVAGRSLLVSEFFLPTFQTSP